MKKVRLDILLVERGMADSRSMAQRLIMAGQVRVNGEVILRSAAPIAPDVRLEVESKPRFVSRGGEKLEAAIQSFKVDAVGKDFELWPGRCGKGQTAFVCDGGPHAKVKAVLVGGSA